MPEYNKYQREVKLLPDDADIPHMISDFLHSSIQRTQRHREKTSSVIAE